MMSGCLLGMDVSSSLALNRLLGCFYLIGRVTRNSEPAFIVLVTDMVPPFSSIISLDNERPNPVPFSDKVPCVEIKSSRLNNILSFSA